MKIIIETHSMLDLKTNRKIWKPDINYIWKSPNHLWIFEFSINWFKKVFSIRIR